MGKVKNVLFIMCDQLRADHLSCAGHPHLKTPAIDALAARGVRFPRAYVQSGVCGPSRMSFYTGRYVSSHGATWNRVPLSLRENADDTWVQVGGQWYALGQPLGIDFGGIGGQIGDIAQLIRDPKAVAVEKVGDIECDRISGKLEPGADLTDQLGELAENLPVDLGALAKGDADVSVWVGRSDGLIHRVQLSTAGSGDVQQTGGLTIDLSVLPADPVTIEAPANAKPITDLLTGLLGDASGLGDLGGLLEGLDLGQLLGGAGGLDLGQLGGALSGATA